MLMVVKQLLRFLQPYKSLAALFFGTMLLNLAFISFAPLSFKILIDKAIEPHDSAYFFLIMKILGTSGLICLACGIVSDYVLAKLTARVQADLRRKLFAQMQHLPISYFQKARAGDLLSYFSVDLPAIETAMTSILTIGVQSAVVVFFSTLVLFYLQWSMALLILIGAAVIFIGPYLLGRRAQAVQTAYRERMAAMLGEVQENIKAQKVIKGFNLQAGVIDSFATRLRLFSVANYRKNLMSAQMERIPMVSLMLINFAIIGLGSYLALEEYITVGALVAFFTMYTSMGNSVFNLTYILPVFTDAFISMERINQILSLPREPQGGTCSAQLEERRPNIEVDRLSFAYDDKRQALQQISLSIPAGTTAAFVGSSGSGKSTMVQMLLGFYEPDEGEVRINGVSFPSVDRDRYREQIGVVFQENFLFQGTLLDNIRVSKPDATLDEVIAAAQKAEIHDHIANLPDGYDTVVYDEGNNFSGGQRQRLAIARAILRDPSILLLDEATSALDPISEAAINRTFAELSRNRTVITVTHRLASIKEVDHIFVFDQGKLVEQGNHEELLEKGGYYRKLWEKQSGLSISSGGQEATIDEERLSQLPFFRGVARDVLQDITNLFNTETVPAGQAIIHEGDPGEKFYLIARGRVEITRKTPDTPTGQTRLAVLEDGDHFGEMALLENAPRNATVTAIAPCVLLTLQRKVLHYLLSKHPEIDAHVRQTIEQRRS